MNATDLEPYGFFIQEGYPARVVSYSPREHANGRVIRPGTGVHGLMRKYATEKFLVGIVEEGEINWFVGVGRGSDDKALLLAVTEDGKALIEYSEVPDFSGYPRVCFIYFEKENLAHQVLLVDAVPYTEEEIFGTVATVGGER